MSQENVEIVRCSIDAWNRRDWDAALKDAAPSFEFDFSRSMGPGRGVYRLDQMGQYFRELTEAWEQLRLEPDEIIEAGEQVVTPNTLYAQGRDGIQVQARSAWVWTIRDGQVTHLCFYQERQEALEAAGLSEQKLTPTRDSNLNPAGGTQPPSGRSAHNAGRS
jgi:ketosteroid isomerase-like protein